MPSCDWGNAMCSICSIIDTIEHYINWVCVTVLFDVYCVSVGLALDWNYNKFLKEFSKGDITAAEEIGLEEELVGRVNYSKECVQCDTIT